MFFFVLFFAHTNVGNSLVFTWTSQPYRNAHQEGTPN